MVLINKNSKDLYQQNDQSYEKTIRKLESTFDNIINCSLQEYANRSEWYYNNKDMDQLESNSSKLEKKRKNCLRSSKALSKVLKKVKKDYSTSQSQKSFVKLVQQQQQNVNETTPLDENSGSLNKSSSPRSIVNDQKNYFTSFFDELQGKKNSNQKTTFNKKNSNIDNNNNINNNINTSSNQKPDKDKETGEDYCNDNKKSSTSSKLNNIFSSNCLPPSNYDKNTMSKCGGIQSSGTNINSSTTPNTYLDNTGSCNSKSNLNSKAIGQYSANPQSTSILKQKNYYGNTPTCGNNPIYSIDENSDKRSLDYSLSQTNNSLKNFSAKNMMYFNSDNINPNNNTVIDENDEAVNIDSIDLQNYHNEEYQELDSENFLKNMKFVAGLNTGLEASIDIIGTNE